jgi:photosystem II stability/assembly factor-like uncharacterized protein
MEKIKRMKLKLLFPLAIFILIAVSVGAPVWAQVGQPNKQYFPYMANLKPVATRWIGPEGGTVTVLVADPNNAAILYAGTIASGVYKTTNGGVNWTAANTNIKNFLINSLAIDPKDSAILYAGTDGQGVYKSTNGGASWGAVNTGIDANEAVYSLAVNPGNTDLVFAGTRKKGTSDGNLYKTVDKGANWSKVFTRTGNWFNGLAINPNKPHIILAATEYNGPYISTTYGSSGNWSETSITSGDRTSGRAVAFDPRSGTDRAYFAAWNNDFYRSTDNGQHWGLEDSGLSDTNVALNGIAVDPNNSNIVYLAAQKSSVAGVLKSGNMADDWGGAGLKGKQVNTIALPRGAWNTVYAGTYRDGVYKSTDGGVNWARSASGLGASYVTGMAFKGTSTYYSATYGGGILKSTDAGANWTEFNTNLTDLNINGLVQHPTNPNIIFALTANSGLRQYNLLTGTGWLAAEGLPEKFEKAAIALHDDPETALASTLAGVNAMAFAPSDSQIAYLATNGDGVYKTTDSGVNFSRKGLANEVIKSVAVNASDPNIVYVATSTKGVVKRSPDGGSAWVSLELPSSEFQKVVNVVAMCPGATDVLCVGTTNGVWKYNGTAWTAAGLQGYTITSLVADPKGTNILFAGTDRGAYYSSDLINWSILDANLSGVRIASINFSPEPLEWSIIYVGTTEKGALRTNLYR